MDHLGRSGGVDIVLAGHSMMEHAGNARFMTEQLGVPVYNAALSSISPEIQTSWLRDEVIPRLNPALVVLGMSSVDFNANVNNPNLERIGNECCPSIQSWTARIEDWFSSFSYLVRYRALLNSPNAAARTFRWVRSRELVEGFRLDPTGFPVKEDEPSFSLSNLHVDHVKSTILHQYQIEESSADAIVRLIREIQRTGTRVALVEMPVTKEFVSLHPQGSADYEAFRRSLRSVASAADVPLLNSSPDLGQHRYFFDSHHMNLEGSIAFSEEVAWWLARRSGAAYVRGPQVSVGSSPLSEHLRDPLPRLAIP